VRAGINNMGVSVPFPHLPLLMQPTFTGSSRAHREQDSVSETSHPDTYIGLKRSLRREALLLMS
jgi:hypothetical protein